jgi:hypothetical protein
MKNVFKIMLFVLILSGLAYPIFQQNMPEFITASLLTVDKEVDLAKENKRMLFALNVYHDEIAGITADLSDYLGDESLQLGIIKFVDLGTTNPHLLDLEPLENTPTAKTIQESERRTATLSDSHFYRIEARDEEEELISFIVIYVDKDIAKKGLAALKYDSALVKNFRTTYLTDPYQELTWSGSGGTLFYSVTFEGTDTTKIFKTTKESLSLNWGTDIQDGEYTVKVYRYDKNGFKSTSPATATITIETVVSTAEVKVSPISGIYDIGTEVTIENNDEDMDTFYWTEVNGVEGVHHKLKNDEATITLNTNTKLYYYTKNKATRKTSQIQKIIYLVKGAPAAPLTKEEPLKLQSLSQPTANSASSKTGVEKKSSDSIKKNLERKLKLLENRLKTASLSEKDKTVLEGRLRLIRLKIQ